MFQPVSKEQNHTGNLLIQPSLEIGKEDDEQEKEADTVADKVMRMSSGNGSDDGIGINTGNKVRKMTDPTEKNVGTMHSGQPAIQKMSAQNQSGINAPASVEKGINSTKGSGQSLTPEVQEEMGSKLGTDLGNVKVHTDSNAVQMSRDISAKAFTHGNDIYFNQGQYNPSSNEGKHLLAHELTHTVQQSGQIKPKIQRQTLTNATNLIRNGQIDAGLADKDMRLAFSTAGVSGPKLMDVAGMETVLGAVIANGLGVSYLPPVTGNPPFSQYSVLQRSSIAYVLGMIKTRQLYMETNNQYLINPAAETDPNSSATPAATDFMSSSLNYTAVLNQIRNVDKVNTVPGWAFNLVSENPDMAVMEKAVFLSQLTRDLAAGGTVINQPVQYGSGDIAAASDTGFLTQLGAILNDENRIKTLIDAQAQLMFAQMGAPTGTAMGDSLLASSGDTGTSTGLFGSGTPGVGGNPTSMPVGVGYFAYSAAAGVPTPQLGQGLVGNNLTVNYPSGNTTLEIMLNAYGFDAPPPNLSTLTLSITAGTGRLARAFTITINGSLGVPGSTSTTGTGIPGIVVVPSTTGTMTGAYISLDATYAGSPVRINVTRTTPLPAAGAISRDDEVQLMVTTNGRLDGIVQNLEAKELFDSGSFISKSIPTLQNSSRTSDHELATKIVEFSDGLNISAIMAMLTSTTTGSADFSSFFKLEGKGINSGAPLPQKFRDDNPGLTDAQLLKKIEELDKVKLTSYYKSDPRYSTLDYDGIIAMLETYRSSQAGGTGNFMNISSTTDPQGTGTNSGLNNDFPDYYNEYISGTVFGDAVVMEDLLIKDPDGDISRNNNEILSALRSLSFLKLILEQKGLKEADFAKMNVTVTVGGKLIPANLGEIPTEASASHTAKDSADRKKFKTGKVNDYSIQVMASNPENVNTQKLTYEALGWTCVTEPASDGSTRLLVRNFANVNDAMAKLNTIRSGGYPSAFVKTNPR